MTCYVIDTETNGHEKPEVIELATGFLSKETLHEVRVQRFLPKKPSLPGALAVHHILDRELDACEPAATAKLPSDTQYIIGHNVDYDWQALGSPDVRRICTLAIARKCYPTADSHKLGAMLYMLHPEQATAREMLQRAHAADADVVNCYVVLRLMLDKLEWGPLDDIKRLWEFSELARLPSHWGFGKFKGQPLGAADKGYISWCLRQPDMDPYLIKAIRAL